jgi:hypothetical protein
MSRKYGETRGSPHYENCCLRISKAAVEALATERMKFVHHVPRPRAGTRPSSIPTISILCVTQRRLWPVDNLDGRETLDESCSLLISRLTSFHFRARSAHLMVQQSSTRCFLLCLLAAALKRFRSLSGKFKRSDLLGIKDEKCAPL